MKQLSTFISESFEELQESAIKKEQKIVDKTPKTDDSLDDKETIKNMGKGEEEILEKKKADAKKSKEKNEDDEESDEDIETTKGKKDDEESDED